MVRWQNKSIHTRLSLAYLALARPIWFLAQYRGVTINERYCLVCYVKPLSPMESRWSTTDGDDTSRDSGVGLDSAPSSPNQLFSLEVNRTPAIRLDFSGLLPSPANTVRLMCDVAVFRRRSWTKLHGAR